MPSPSARCPCGCIDAFGVDAHVISAALQDGDLDAAISAGLLASIACPGCQPACQERLRLARDDRRAAMAARERFRARQARLARRQQERLLRREAAGTASHKVPALPPAAEAALARARAKAAGFSPE